MRCLLLCLFCTVALATTPLEYARLLSEQFMSSPSSFLKYEYGSAIIMDAMYEAAGNSELSDLATRLDGVLDTFINTSSAAAYGFLHGTVPSFDRSVGDKYGLPPIIFLARAKYYTKYPSRRPASYNSTAYNTDIEVAVQTAENYITPFPHRLYTGLYSRDDGGQWVGQLAPGNSFVWTDDIYMGSGVLSRLATLLNRSDYADSVIQYQLQFAEKLADTDSVWFHGWNNATGNHSCCKWARSNAWAICSHLEALRMIDSAFPTNSNRATILELFQKHASAIAALQSTDGRWYQIVDQSGTFLETSSTAMFLWAFSHGVDEGYLDAATFNPVIELAWTALQTTISSSGTVSGVCIGTSIGANISYYNERSTTFSKASPGLGSVLRAILTRVNRTNTTGASSSETVVPTVTSSVSSTTDGAVSSAATVAQSSSPAIISSSPVGISSVVPTGETSTSSPAGGAASGIAPMAMLALLCLFKSLW